MRVLQNWIPVVPAFGLARFVAGRFGRLFRLGLLTVTLLASVAENHAATPVPTTPSRVLTPFWRNRPVLGFALKGGNGIAPVPEYLLATTSTSAPDFAYDARPYGTEVLWADNLLVVRPLGGWNPATLMGEQLEYGAGSTAADLCYKNQDGSLGYRWNLLAPRLSSYSDIGYTGGALTYVLDNTPWDLPTTATLDAAGNYGQSSPPANLNQWSTFIQGFAQQLVSLNIATGTDAPRFRQGTECDFIDRFNGNQTQYNAQYAASAAAVKSVFPNAQFGPFNAGVNSRVTHAALATYCKTNNLPFDFAAISFYEVANNGTNKFTDTDTRWASTVNDWTTIETNLGRSVSREIHEFGILLNEAGLSTSEPGAWGAAWTFNYLMKLYACGLQRSSHWDSTEAIAGTARNPTLSALKGDGWVYTVLDSLAGGQWSYLTPPANSPAGTKYTSVCVTKGNRVYVLVSAINVVTAGNAARSLDSRSITVSLPKSTATIWDSRTVRYTALTRSTALYDLIRADLDAQHPEYFIADTANNINWSTVPGLTANVAIMAGTAGKTWVASNWTTGQNYRQSVVDSLTLKTFTGVGTVTNQTSSYNLTFPMENAAVMVIAIDNLPTISIAATDPTSAEPGSDTGSFTVTRSGGVTWATTVNLTFTGTATLGNDYTTLANTLTFAAGETSKTLTVTPIDDALAESSETVVATLAAGSDYTVAASPAGTATVTIADNPNRTTPSISAAPTASSLTYGQTLASSTLSGGSASVPGAFTFTAPSTTPTTGTTSQGYTFTPTDTASTNLVIGTVSVTVTQATPSITAPAASPILLGQTLAASTLSGGSASVPGTFSFNTPSFQPLAAGSADQAVTFTPTDTVNYTTVSTTVNVTVIATATWTGGGTDTNWVTPVNWGGTAPVAGNRLVFAGTTRLANVNNLAADTAFAGIHFTNDPGVTAGSFTLSGNRIILGGDIVTTGNATTGSNSATLSLALVLSGNRTLTANTKHNVTLSGAITQIGGARSLTKEGAASLTLAGNNSFSGGFTLNNGTATVTAPAALGTGPLGWATTGNAVSLIFTTTGGTVGNPINWGSGNVTINASQGNLAALVFANSGFTSGAGTKTLTLQGSSTAANDFQNLIPVGTGSTTVAMNGAGNWKLSNDSNAFSGQLQVSQGTLTITSLANTGNLSAAGTGAVTPLIRIGSGTGDGMLNYIGSGNATSNRSVQIGNGNTVTFTGGAKITNNGTGSLVFTAVSFNPAMTTGTPARTLTLGGFNTGSNEIQGVIQNNVTTGPVSVTKIDIGTWILSANNTYTGNTTLARGTLATALLSASGVASGVGAGGLVFDGGTLKYTGAALTWTRNFSLGTNGAEFDLSTATGQLVIQNTLSYLGNGTRTLTFTTASSGGRLNTSLADGPGGATTLVKKGSGSLLLSAANTYTGPLQILQGSVQYGDAGPGGESSAPGHSVAISGGASLDFLHAGNNTIAYDAPISGAGSVSMNYNNIASGGSLILGGNNSFSGGLSINPASGSSLLALKAGGPSALGTGNVSISQYGALDLNGFSNTIGLLSSSVSTARVTNSGTADATLTLGGSGNQTFAGVIQDGIKKISLFKTGPGTQILSGNNTYTGNTTVIQGGFQFTAGRLAFAPLENGVCNRITVGSAATVTLSGTFDFDLSKADFTSGNSWSLVVASTSTTTFGASFEVVGFTKSTAPGGNVWTKNESPRTWTFAESTGVLRLQISGYADWLTGFPSLANTAAGADPDYDGVANLLEYVLGGNPSLVNTGSSLFAASLVPEGMRFTFHRTDNSETGATLTFQYSRNLLVWADLLISATSGGPDANGVVFTVEENAAAADLVTVTVPADASGRIFGRLRAVTAP